jgi:hypothetical protein
MQPGTESSQIIHQMALPKSQFLVAARVNYRAGCAARYRKFSNHPPDGSGKESVLSEHRSTIEQGVQPGTESSQIIQQMALAKSRFLVAALVNYRAGRAARYRKFSNHPPDSSGQESVLSGSTSQL